MAVLVTSRIGASLARASGARRAVRSVVPLNVRAFKDEAKKQDKAEVAKHEKPGAVAPQRQHLAPQQRVRTLFDEMEREMNQLSRSFLGDAFSPFLTPFAPRHRRVDPFESLLAAPVFNEMPTAMRLAADIHEDDKGFTIKADVPGMTKDDVKVSLEGRVLTISGERREEKKEEMEGRVTWVERSHGSFFRSFGLPETVDPEGISAAIKDGVMTVTVPKRPQEPKPAAKEIRIEG